HHRAQEEDWRFWLLPRLDTAKMNSARPRAVLDHLGKTITRRNSNISSGALFVRKLMLLICVVGVVTLANPWAPLARSGFNVDLARLGDQVKAKLASLKAEGTCPGVTVGFILADGRSTGVSVGLADVEAQIPLKPSDRFLAGSIGKTFVAAVTLQLVEE